MKRAAVLAGSLAVVLISFVGLSACTSTGTVADVGSPTAPAEARVRVTTDFGEHVVFDVVVAVSPGMTAMDALAQVASVDTTYGGGFVEGINGIGTGVSGRFVKRDWFYSVNGFTARTGAAGYVLHDGDTEHWDYRDWSFRRNASATLGAFPAAFVYGYEGKTRTSIVVYDSGFAGEAESLARILKSSGASQVETALLGELDGGGLEDSNVLVVAPCGADLVREVSWRWDRLGLFARFDGSILETYDPSGELATVHGDSTGVVLPMQNPWNPGGTGACESVAVIVSGCDETGVRSASRLLSGSCRELAYSSGAVVEGESWFTLP